MSTLSCCNPTQAHASTFCPFFNESFSVVIIALVKSRAIYKYPVFISYTKPLPVHICFEASQVFSGNLFRLSSWKRSFKFVSMYASHLNIFTLCACICYIFVVIFYSINSLSIWAFLHIKSFVFWNRPLRIWSYKCTICR